jgi:hypothetical protein
MMVAGYALADRLTKLASKIMGVWRHFNFGFPKQL